MSAKSVCIAFIGKYTEIQVDISYFKRDSQESRATCQVFSQLSAALTSVHSSYWNA